MVNLKDEDEVWYYYFLLDIFYDITFVDGVEYTESERDEGGEESDL